jgi:glycine oxidase
MLDYIIVGSGLSGISFAEELLSRGKKLIVFDDGSQNSSTVAGGLYNPVILKRFTLAWNAGSQLDIALPFYRKLEKKLQVSLLEDLPVYRKFSSVEEQNNWFEAMDKPHIAPFLDGKLVSEINPNIPSSFSFGRVLETGRLDTSLMIQKYKEHLLSNGLFAPGSFQHNKLQINKEGVSYEQFTAKRVIFCEGFGMRENPFFNYLPLHGNKGEYIIIKSPDLKLQVAVKSSVFILPLGKDLYKVGATYDNRDTDPEPTVKAKETLKSQVEKLITCEFEVIDQVAGIRPASKDRKPLVGQHPDHKALFCCNGFGSRGVLVAPAIAKNLISSIEDNEALDPETDIKRFSKN